MEQRGYTYPLYAKILHLGMAITGVAAFLTGEVAEDGGHSAGYLLHAWLGLSLAAFVLMRVARGCIGPGPLRFSGWSLFSRRQWMLGWQDLRGLLLLQLPKRGMHEGLAGLTQAFGLLLFGWMAATGTGLFVLGDGPVNALFGMTEEIHEVGEALIPLYLALHVGSVIVHSLAGDPIWKRMWKFGTNRRPASTRQAMGDQGVPGTD